MNVEPREYSSAHRAERWHDLFRQAQTSDVQLRRALRSIATRDWHGDTGAMGEAITTALEYYQPPKARERRHD